MRLFPLCRGHLANVSLVPQVAWAIYVTEYDQCLIARTTPARSLVEVVIAREGNQ